jgi:predicted negative regulator of RcsB-dependent stress response
VASRTEDEELAVIRDWWQRNGKPLLAGGILALVMVFGWQYWTDYRANQAAVASALYQQLLNAVLVPAGTPDPAAVAEISARLQNEFPGSAYAQYGSLFVARLAVDSGKLDDAQAALQAVLDKPADATLDELARQRLARVLLARDQAEEALQLLTGEAPAAFAASREELRGDLLLRLGRKDEARAAFSAAMQLLGPEAAGGATLQLKIDDLANGDA